MQKDASKHMSPLSLVADGGDDDDDDDATLVWHMPSDVCSVRDARHEQRTTAVKTSTNRCVLWSKYSLLIKKTLNFNIFTCRVETNVEQQIAMNDSGNHVLFVLYNVTK